MRLARFRCGCLLTICDGLVPRVGTKVGTVRLGFYAVTRITAHIEAAP